MKGESRLRGWKGGLKSYHVWKNIPFHHGVRSYIPFLLTLLSVVGVPPCEQKRRKNSKRDWETSHGNLSQIPNRVQKGNVETMDGNYGNSGIVESGVPLGLMVLKSSYNYAKDRL